MMTPLHHLLLISGRLKEQVEKVTECIHLLIAHKANVNISRNNDIKKILGEMKKK